MKLFAVIILMFLAPALLPAQSGDLSLDADTSATYLTPMEYAFMMHEEPKFMLRLPFLGVGAEVMLLPGLTMMGQFIYGSLDMRVRQVEAELRYYLNHQGKGRSNMSGNYLAIGSSRGTPNFLRRNQLSGAYSYNAIYPVYARIGMQRRFLGKGLVDLGFKVGWLSEVYSNSSHGREDFNSLGVSTVATLGFGWVFNSRKDLDWNALCPVTKCYDADNWLLKFNTADLFSFKFHKLGTNIFLTPKIALEYKLFKSAFSINTGVSAMIMAGKYADIGFRDNYWMDYDIYAEGRYYYNLKRRIMQGKTGNGMSANYIAAGWLKKEQRGNGEILWDASFPFVATGIQRTLGDHFYFDVKLGLGMEPSLQNVAEGSARVWDTQGVLDIQIGFKF